ncbi:MULTISPECIES: universal stress protein [Actinomadura]|uniref:Universal stress protein n=1 Tax=Actinomadura litoris TaxID=2678616 RepID=A0A7K1L5V1_9ACTN|nr:MULTISPECIES: universal stress protein [Actinomadura]MBT2212697.1 universal stress protein [Actinomadura sp. NEAU-AAG7]MUN39673.1 universal stress protein [Actinomadura litoris]
MNQIVVGADGSEQSLAATAWAAEEAARRGASLRVVLVVAPWLFDVPVDPRAGAVRKWLLDGGEEIVGRAVAVARERAPGVEVTGVQRGGNAAEVLMEEARDALMLVAGTRGTGGLTGLVLGSVALQVASHAERPAVIVPAGEAADGGHGEVVVGVDGSAGSAAAIGFAFEEAALRRARLRAVLAWTHPASTAPEALRPPAFDPENARAERERALAESLAGWCERFPEVEVAREVVYRRAVRALADASAGAELLVVGSRGRGGFTGLLLGSVGHAMLHRAACPVAVVRSPRD